ncbi:MAG: GTPase [Methylovulum sp.]|jgi:GTPase Era involved in 16S rRNA processing
MAYDYSDLIETSKTWASLAQSAGWLDEDLADKLLNLDTHLPNALFNKDSRPLIVAFFGGSGVGKSTLINRLAGKPIAKAGIERPTSREVTLFYHQSLSIQHLPDHLPLSHINTAQHDEEAQKNIIWIDMPDIDSTTQANKQLVLQWLPHIDVLIYVVSPERYRDQKSWQLLLAEGARHGWLFILNQWDNGLPEQFDDFKVQLHKAGFFDPVIFKTICADNAQPDEFKQFEITITSLATQHIIEQLEQREQQVRKTELKTQLQSILNTLAQCPSEQRVLEEWDKHWQQSHKQLSQGLLWPCQQVANYYTDHASDLIQHAAHPIIAIWDTWAQSRLLDVLDEFFIDLQQCHLPSKPFKARVAQISDKTTKLMQHKIELAARHALVNPGNSWQRYFLKSMHVCEILLPLAAMMWAGSQVFIAFYQSNQSNMHYLGVDFAIHSALLIALTWLPPFFIIKKMQPSIKSSLLRGLDKGINQGMYSIDKQISEAIQLVYQDYNESMRSLKELIEHCEDTNAEQRLTIEKNSPLTRMLLN